MQLVDAVSGAHLWAENYERTFSPEAVFELQDDLVPRIVSTVADSSGVLPHSISEMLRSEEPEQLSPVRGGAALASATSNASLPRSMRRRETLWSGRLRMRRIKPSCWAMLAMVLQGRAHARVQRSGLIPSGARWRPRIVPLRPRRPITSPISPWPRALFFRREIVAFRSAAERTIALNPMDSSTIAYLGDLMLHAGDWERGCALVERARQLNPNHPGWYWFAALLRCLPQAGLPRRARGRPQDQHAGRLLCRPR